MYYFISMNLFFLSLNSFFLSINLMNYKNNFLLEYNFLNLNSMKFEFIMFIDWMSMLFFSTILMISSMVLIYSIEYMNMDLNISRFMKLILIFVLSMILMIICPNMITILIGWDGLGLSSYCLIIFYQNNKSMNSGLITILMNRFGDICILMSISLMIYLYNWNFIFENKKMIFLLTLILFLTSITKSAQIPFSSWLPMAMAAPTPVSSLVHSSTLVTAGVFLMIRFNKIINLSIINVMMYTSLFTMFMAGMNANFEFDLKKIIALSTLSQLSLMFFILSFNLPKLTFFHLITHAMFKSLLFLCSGILIHNSYENQDIRLISINSYNMKFMNSIFNLASLALCGIPFLTGFYSKDLIIEMFNMLNNNHFMFFILYFSMLLTLLYTLRMIFYSSLMQPKSLIFMPININSIMYKSIFILILNSIILGSMLNWLMFSSINYIFLNKFNKLFIFMNFMLMFPLTYIIIKMNFMKNKFNYYLLKLINLSFFLNLIYKKNKINLMKLNFYLIKNMDFGWLEYLIIYIYIKKFNNYYMKMNFNLLMNLMTISLMIFIMMII